MANICTNIFYAYSENPKNIKKIQDFFDKEGIEYDFSLDFLDATFDSRWTLPEDLMNELFKSLPDKTDIYMRCLSYEFGCDYIAYWKCEDEKGWYQIV